MRDPFIVKVQLSLTTTHNKPQVLVYNENQDVYWEDVAGDEIIKTMKGRTKAYFWAVRNVKGVIEIGDEAASPGW